MKQLIEKIKELRQNPYSEYERLSHNKAVDEILNIIQDHESKSFDPISVGFTKLNDIVFNKIDNHHEFILERMNIPNLWLLKHIIGIDAFKKDPLPLKILNHRLGVEILHGLGIIKHE